MLGLCLQPSRINWAQPPLMAQPRCQSATQEIPIMVSPPLSRTYESENWKPKKEKKDRSSPCAEGLILETFGQHFDTFEPGRDLRILKTAKYK